jgi:hypothetical protein
MLAPRRWQAAAPLPLAVALTATIAIDVGLAPIKPSFFRWHPYRDQLEELHRIIGPEASLSVTNRLAPSFAHRRQYVLALDFTLNRELNAALGLPDYRDTMFHLFDLTALGGSRDREHRLAQLLADTRYGVRYYRFPLVLFERGLTRRPPPELEALMAGDGGEGPGVRIFPAVFFQVSDASTVQHDLGVGGRGAALRFIKGHHGAAYRPEVIRPPGSYAVDFHLTLDTPTFGPIVDLDVISSRGRHPHVSRRLTGADFAGARPCQPFTLPVEIPAETTALELRARSRGAAFSLCKVVLRSAAPTGQAAGQAERAISKGSRP